ncbi:hypothetical protein METBISCDRAFT_21561 [Metschnikowia bicuspidata]|uniref:Hyaluronan/mRNA-binding protein domain-containing protein n=1 Tax=Metschnikowia bicuspidata TaxID=27322 RepID=A0A4P9ZIK2_9ASCO|nr:hypothetical protein METBISCDRAFT_21561 [Metschnikowia bicuspidata]
MPREILRKTTSSKKTDVPPTSADPAKARKNRKSVTGNEAAFKDKIKNKAVAAPTGGPRREKKPFDRHSRTNKTDSKKKIAQGWGDGRREVDDEAAALADAVTELAVDAKSEPAAPVGKSLKEYLAEQQQLEQALSKSTTKKVNVGSEEKWTSFEVIQKETLPLVEPTFSKKIRQRAPKEKKLLDFTASFGEQAPRFNGKNPGFNGKKAALKPAAINDLPSL